MMIRPEVWLRLRFGTFLRIIRKLFKESERKQCTET